MTGLAANLVFQTLIMATGAQPYAEAYKTSEETGKPLLVLVGADWCPGCRRVQQSGASGSDAIAGKRIRRHGCVRF